MYAVSLDHVSKTYAPRATGWRGLFMPPTGPGFQALADISFTVDHGEFFALLGPIF